MFVDIEKCTNGPDGLQTRESLNFALLDLVRLRIIMNERTLYERDKFCFWWNCTPRHVTECVTCIICPWQNRSTTRKNWQLTIQRMARKKCNFKIWKWQWPCSMCARCNIRKLITYSCQNFKPHFSQRDSINYMVKLII